MGRRHEPSPTPPSVTRWRGVSISRKLVDRVLAGHGTRAAAVPPFRKWYDRRPTSGLRPGQADREAAAAATSRTPRAIGSIRKASHVKLRMAWPSSNRATAVAQFVTEWWGPTRRQGQRRCHRGRHARVDLTPPEYDRPARRTSIRTCGAGSATSTRAPLLEPFTTDRDRWVERHVLVERPLRRAVHAAGPDE